MVNRKRNVHSGFLTCRNISRKRKVDHFICWCVKAVMFPAGLCRNRFSINQQIAAFWFGFF